jgi:hypothetical protein
MCQIRLTVFCLYKVNAVRQNHPLLTHALMIENELPMTALQAMNLQMGFCHREIREAHLSTCTLFLACVKGSMPELDSVRKRKEM